MQEVNNVQTPSLATPAPNKTSIDAVKTPSLYELHDNFVSFFKLLLEVDRRMNPDRYEKSAVAVSDTNNDG